MNDFFKRILRIIFKGTLFLIICIVVYLVSAILLSIIPVNRSFKDSEQGITIFVLSNGVHTDIVVPLKNEFADWTEKINYQNTLAKDSTAKYAGFGWGDKGFYLETPTWSDLKTSTALKAAFGLGSSAMHITYYIKTLQENERCKAIVVSAQQYRALTDYIWDSFEKDKDGNAVYINAKAYGHYDMFYEAKGIYNLFYTCNTWTNSGLKHTGIRTALWTPSDKGIFLHF